MHTQQGDVWYADEGPLLTGPEFNHRPLLWSLGGCIEVSEAHTTKVRGQADQNVPTKIKPNESWIKTFNYLTVFTKRYNLYEYKLI